MTRGCPALFLPPSGPKLHACFFLFSFVLFIFVFGFPLFSLFFIFVQKKNQKSKDETKFNERFSKNKNREKKDQTMCVSSTYFLGQLVCCMFLYSLLVLNMNTKPRKAKPSPPPEQERTTEGGGGISTQATPTTLGLNIHIRKSPEKKKKGKQKVILVLFQFQSLGTTVLFCSTVHTPAPRCVRGCRRLKTCSSQQSGLGGEIENVCITAKCI